MKDGIVFILVIGILMFTACWLSSSSKYDSIVEYVKPECLIKKN